ncbi:MAG: cysteine hydrolase [Zoogloeaceae bacterium]|jgi:nicotinamidase-related amidase|nr:cysteine hydrolase [Zoogloeaceae bacterium]
MTEAFQPALLIIDVQNDYFAGGKMELCAPLAALASIERIRERFREKACPVIHVQHISAGAGAKFFLPNTEGARIHPNLTPAGDEYLVVKHLPNSFTDTRLADLIDALRIERLVICGMMSHMCVDSTTRACLDRKIKTTVLADACATRDLVYRNETIPAKTVHACSMAALNGRFARVVDTAEFADGF